MGGGRAHYGASPTLERDEGLDFRWKFSCTGSPPPALSQSHPLTNYLPCAVCGPTPCVPQLYPQFAKNPFWVAGESYG